MNTPPQIKHFRVTSLGEVTFTTAPSIQDLRQDLSSMGCLDAETIIEEVDANQQAVERAAPKMPPVKPPKAEVSYFTMPNGDKLKEENGVMYMLQWREISIEELAKRAGCEDIKMQTFEELEILDWVELKPEITETEKEKENEDAN